MAEGELQRLLGFIDEACVPLSTRSFGFTVEVWDLTVATLVRKSVLHCIYLADAASTGTVRRHNREQIRAVAAAVAARKNLRPYTQAAAVDFLKLVEDSWDQKSQTSNG